MKTATSKLPLHNNGGRNSNLEQNPSGGRISQLVSNQIAQSSSFGSFVSAPRSSSVIGKYASPIKVNPQPIEGSFLMMEDSARKLSDMGNYKARGKYQTYGKGEIKGIVTKGDRFNNNF